MTIWQLLVDQNHLRNHLFKSLYHPLCFDQAQHRQGHFQTIFQTTFPMIFETVFLAIFELQHQQTDLLAEPEFANDAESSLEYFQENVEGDMKRHLYWEPHSNVSLGLISDRVPLIQLTYVRESQAF